VTRTLRSLPLLVALAAAAVAAAPPANAAPARLDEPNTADIAVSSGAVRYGTVNARALTQAVLPGTYWGGAYTASTGERVTIYASTNYPEDASTGQRWANFFASLLHGPELSSLTSYMLTPNQVSRICGFDALACYGDATLVIPGEDLEEISVEALIAHEYGHHVAANRRDDPWPAVDWGTKRWSSYEQVCAKAKSGDLVPGAEDATDYDRNPGEGFAETYRVLNERRLGIPETPWQIVSQIMYPDATALSLLQQDVVSPWNGPTTSTRTGSVSAKTKTKSFTTATPLDGKLSVSVRAPKNGRVALDLLTSTGTRVARTTARASGTASVSTTVCGTRAYSARVSRLSGSGSFGLTVSRP
jgi:hypothetical protein